MPNSVLDDWHNMREDKSYVELVNEAVCDGALMLMDLPKVENRIRTQSYRIAKKIALSSKRKRTSIKNLSSCINVYEHEVVRPVEQREVIYNLSSCNEELE